MNFVEDPSFVVVNRVVFNGFINIFFLQAIDNLNMIKIDDDTASSATWDVKDHISLQCHLYIFKRCYEW